MMASSNFALIMTSSLYMPIQVITQENIRITSGLRVRIARSSAELRAAASLRAAAFADDNSTTSDFTLQVKPQCPGFTSIACATFHIHLSAGAERCCRPQSYRRMKADEEWDILERKIAGKETGWEVAASPQPHYCYSQHRLTCLDNRSLCRPHPIRAQCVASAVSNACRTSELSAWWPALMTLEVMLS